MIPILYKSTETEFKSQGVGSLNDAISCSVTEERNGEFELEMTYPSAGQHYKDITMRSIIFAKPNPHGARQAFRVYKITKPISGKVKILARHISYDLSSIPISRCSANDLSTAIKLLKSMTTTKNKFTFSADFASDGAFSVDVPTATRSVMGGSIGSILDVYGGEYYYNNFSIKLMKSRGRDNGVRILYGHNMTDVKQEENIAKVYTGIYPYWKSDNDYFELPEKLVSTSVNGDMMRILPVDMTEYFEDKPTADSLRTYAKRYIKIYNLDAPSISLTVSFADLSKSLEYKSTTKEQEVNLCDTVTVIFEELGIAAKAKCTKVKYDVLADRYDKITLSNKTMTTIIDTLARVAGHTNYNENQYLGWNGMGGDMSSQNIPDVDISDIPDVDIGDVPSADVPDFPDLGDMTTTAQYKVSYECVDSNMITGKYTAGDAPLGGTI